ncbi:YwpF-like family protein [Metabacillus sp. GX 13764]|uniref:YwpF-like family protein n=1 Tax=Metabacillus kandeliae TaxID=2900151 RepID=UPI001E6178D7|nr:YwpF-like family protein [Metabacillus kandeliae]MCD7034625.1 YwpF-like family protein [Metabacillus kandeliae]
MKTFRLVGMKIERDERYAEIPLEGGLIINKEDGENRWMIEALLNKNYLSYFQELKEKDDELQMLVTITKSTNTPAKVTAVIKEVVELEQDKVSVLFEGGLTANRPRGDAEKLLSELIDEGLTGEELLQAFSSKWHNLEEAKS